MATTVLTGTGNPTYTNNTGGSVRIVVNYATNVTKTSIAGVLNTIAAGGSGSENVSFTVTSGGSDVNTITFNGTGTTTFSFSSNSAGTFTKTIPYNFDYLLSTSGTGPGTQALQVLSNATAIGLDDRRGAGADNDYNDIIVRASKGYFFQNAGRYYYRLNGGVTGYTIGRNLAFTQYGINAANARAGKAYGSNMGFSQNIDFRNGAIPTEFILLAGQTFSFTCDLYNIIIIPENG
jgi:hypothetical protein